MIRHFQPGWRATVGGLEFRVVPGRKASIEDQDLRLDMWDATRQEWRAVSMEIGFLLADFFYENEDVRYPRSSPERFKGGEYYMSECWRAAKKGWQVAAEKLRRERRSLPDPMEVWLP